MRVSSIRCRKDVNLVVDQDTFIGFLLSPNTFGKVCTGPECLKNHLNVFRFKNLSVNLFSFTLPLVPLPHSCPTLMDRRTWYLIQKDR